MRDDTVFKADSDEFARVTDDCNTVITADFVRRHSLDYSYKFELPLNTKTIVISRKIGHEDWPCREVRA